MPTFPDFSRFFRRCCWEVVFGILVDFSQMPTFSTLGHFKPSARVLSAKSIFSIFAQPSSAFHFLGSFQQSNILRQFSTVWYFWAIFSSLIFSGNFQQYDIFRQFSAGWYFWAVFRQADIFRKFSIVWFFQAVFSSLIFLGRREKISVFLRKP